MLNLCILLIDDEKELTTILVERLRIRNFDAYAVNSAEEAFKFIRDKTPDVVLLDLKMPEMNGIEVLKIIKEIDPSIEVIILTGHRLPRGEEETKKIGAFDYMMKPIKIEQVIEKIHQASKKRIIERRYLNR